jgi:hypothetical protein
MTYRLGPGKRVLLSLEVAFRMRSTRAEYRVTVPAERESRGRVATAPPGRDASRLAMPQQARPTNKPRTKSLHSLWGSSGGTTRHRLVWRNCSGRRCWHRSLPEKSAEREKDREEQNEFHGVHPPLCASERTAIR